MAGCGRDAAGLRHGECSGGTVIADASEHATPLARAPQLRARAQRRIAGAQAELVGKQYKDARPAIEQQPWGRDMSVTDPFGNRIIFSEQVSS